MKKTILLILFSLTINHLFAQEKIRFSKTKTAVLEINSKSKIFDKYSGKQISFDEFDKLVKKNPQLITEVKDEDKNGKPISFYIIKPEHINLLKGNKNFNVIPNIKRKDINNKTFNLESNKKNRVLVILQLDFHLPAIRIDHLKEAESSAIKNGLIPVILTSTDSKTTSSFAKENDFKSTIIPNALNLMHKFKTRRFPVFIITNHEGYILSKTFYSYEVEELIKNLSKH